MRLDIELTDAEQGKSAVDGRPPPHELERVPTEGEEVEDSEEDRSPFVRDAKLLRVVGYSHVSRVERRGGMETTQRNPSLALKAPSECVVISLAVMIRSWSEATAGLGGDVERGAG